MALPLYDHRTPTAPLRRSTARPELTVIEGGRVDREARISAAGRQASVYRRRRVGAALLAAAVCASLTLGAARFAGAAAGSTPPADAVIQVRPGDTLWSIALSLDTGLDTRSVVSDIAEANGGATDLQAGQPLIIPAQLADHLARR